MKLLIIIMTLFLVLPAWALECQKLESPQQVVKCVIENHTSTQLGQAEITEASEGIHLAQQRPNPELEYEGMEQDGSGFSSSITLQHTFELGNKRRSRIQVAERERDLVQANVLNRKEQLYIQTVSNLYRVRQIHHELEVVNEIISTFEKITDQYSKAGRLSPEDKISTSVFSIALEENKLKKNSLINEQKRISAQLENGLGRKIALSSKLLPKIKKDWPKLIPSKIAGSQLLKFQKNLELSQAQYNLEKSEAWSDLNIGPKVEFDSSNSSNIKFGATLSLALPLYQTNDGGKAKSMARVQRKKLALKYAKLRLEQHKNYLYGAYNRVSRGIYNALSNKQVNLRHKDLHKMINRGIVSAPIIIELHRQIMDYYEKLHEQELEGVQALWKISALEGNILTKDLK